MSEPDTSPSSPGGLGALLRSPELKKWIKYSCVSLVGVVTTQVILSLPYQHWHRGTWHCTSVDANMFAVAISAMPAYLLNRAWVWGKQGKNSLSREVVPFWAFAFAGFLLSTVFVHIVEHHTDSTWAVRGANLAGFGVLWVARFFVLDKLLFKTAKDGEDAVTRLAEDAPLRVSALLTAAQLAAYDRDGYVLLGPVLSAAEAAEMVDDLVRLKPPVAFGGEGNQTLLVNIHLCDRSVPTRRLCVEGGHIPALTQLIGPDVALTHNQVLWKLPDGAESRSDIPFHQDNGYGELEPFTDVTVWIALTDTDERNGCLRIVPGSHRLGLLQHDMAEVNPFLREAADGAGAVAVPLRAGEAVAFSGLTVHGSGGNHTDAERVGFYARYCEPSTRMVSEHGRAVLDDPHSWMVAGIAPA